MENKHNPHEKHRQRMRVKSAKVGLIDLPEHEVLELLLMYAIPRKDVNPIAHELINTFGSLDRVVDASVSDLKMVKGIGENSAQYLKFLSDFVVCYNKSKNSRIKYKLDNIAKCIQYFRKNFVLEKNENFYIVCLDKKFNLIKTHKIDGVTATAVMADTREFAGLISNKQINSIVIYHTHPFGDVNPTKEDFLSTKKINKICSAIGVNIVDHIIFNETEHYSFRQHKNDTYLDAH